MRARVDGRVVRTNALDLREHDVTHEDALAAIHDADGWIACPSPSTVHVHVGLVDSSTLRTADAVTRALAAAARSRGEHAEQDDEIAAARTELADDVPEVEGLETARERVATVSADVESLRERVERLGGMVAALREADADDETVGADHRAAVATLVDAETERAAAVETLERLQREVREVHDLRERRLRLEDRERRLARAARADLAARMRPSFERARRAVPDGPWRDAFAVVRVARVRAPVVIAVADGPFERASRAAACLDAPVVLTRARV
ncbi:hypothetical protein [Halarchaeum sp. P4]|uniref:DUF7856 family protein n=1 Tax=Halarchaeum sp. P4 TaxID=3421639 RepID=UPI003EB6E711